MKNSSINFLYETVQNNPDKICVADEHNALNFSTLFTRAYNISKVLQKENTINQPVLVYLPKSIDAIVCFAGILLSGNFYVPVDIKSPQKRIEKIIQNLAPYRIMSTHTYEDYLKALSIPHEQIIFLEDINTENNNNSMNEMIAQVRRITDQIIDTDPCYIMYTSGSTGTPKGVVIPHRGVINYIEWAVSCLEVNRDDIIGNQAPFYFDNSTLDIYLSWSTGAQLHLIPESMFLFPIKLIEYLEKKEITFIFFIPSVLISISQMNLLSHNRLASLKKIVFAGEVMPTKHLAYWQKMLPDKVYVNLYGPTEITVDCTYFFVDRIYKPDESLPIGYPCNNSAVLILNEHNECASIGEQGELCVRGSSLALGYWNDEEKTRAEFVQNPLKKNYFDRIYRTGDIVYKNEKDQIIFVGRKDSQIKHMGYRIELGEIEHAAGSLSSVNKCCVLYNNDKKEITLFYEAEKEISSAEFRKTLSALIPNYMIPRKFTFFKKLPLNPNGKIDRKALENEYVNKTE
jgi:amino acid adenylation domain-containing protein